MGLFSFFKKRKDSIDFPIDGKPFPLQEPLPGLSNPGNADIAGTQGFNPFENEHGSQGFNLDNIPLPSEAFKNSTIPNLQMQEPLVQPHNLKFSASQNFSQNIGGQQSFNAPASGFQEPRPIKNDRQENFLPLQGAQKTGLFSPIHDEPIASRAFNNKPPATPKGPKKWDQLLEQTRFPTIKEGFELPAFSTEDTRNRGNGLNDTKTKPCEFFDPLRKGRPVFINISEHQKMVKILGELMACHDAQLKGLERIEYLADLREKSSQKLKAELEEIQRKLIFVDRVIFEDNPYFNDEH